jgi:glycosyltransferase involved in cell wall biosynthesis
MKIRGWWRVSYFYDRRVEELTELKNNIFNLNVWALKQYLIWKLQRRKLIKGVNIIGFAKGDFGLAEHMRLVTHSINTTAISFCVNNSGDTGHHSTTNEELSEYIIEDSPYLINLFTYNSDFIINYCKGAYYKDGKALVMKRQYNIGYGYWELSEYPEAWKVQDKYLNEIWAPSRFIKEVIDKYSTLPVIYMPIAVDFKIPVNYNRLQFNLPENSLLFLFTFDLSSFSARKNPQAVITAFCKAFPVEKKEHVTLVIKVNRIHISEEHTLKVEALIKQIEFDPRIRIIDEVLDRSSILGLIHVCDCYVSLHRAEGFGLGMAEAMKMGKVVIGTNYSGNTDFMNEENSCLVNYKLVPVDKKEYIHVEGGAVWAEPDVNHASTYMKKVYEDKEYAKNKGVAAKLYMDKNHNFKTIGEGYQKRLSEILN